MFRSGKGDRRSSTNGDEKLAALTGDDLVRRARLGDGAAVAGLYARHGQSVHAYLVLQETEDASRIAREAFLAACSTSRTIEGGDRGFRIEVLAQAHELLILEATRDSVASAPPTMLPSVVRRYLRALVPAQRDVIALQVASGLAVSEAATVLGLSEPMAAIAQSRALRRLEDAGTGAVPTQPVPSNLTAAVGRDGGAGAVGALSAAAAAIPPAIPSSALRRRFATVPPAEVAATNRQGGLKVAAIVGTTVGKLALGVGVAAAATAGGAHVAGVIDLPLLPPVTRVSSTQEINDQLPVEEPVEHDAPAVESQHGSDG